MNWVSKPLPDFVFFQEGPGLRNWQWTNEGMKVINVKNILGDGVGSVDTSNSDKYIASIEFESKYKHFEVQEKDIVVASSGNTYGKVGRIEQYNLPLMMNTSVIRFRSKDEKLLNNDFLYCFLRSSLFKNQIEQFVTGGAQPNFGPTHVKKMLIPLPLISIQESIGEFISKYDQLLSNNKRRIELLEESARQLYKEWFVRFRFPGHEHVKIINGVPEGWESKKVGELLMKVKRPGKVKKDDYLEVGEFPCVDQSQGFIGGYTDKSEVIVKEPLPLVVFGDHTRVLKFVDFPFACGADGTQLLHPSDSRLSIEYFYFALIAIDLSNYFYARHFKFLKDQIVLIPSEQLMQAFTEFASTNMKQISKLRNQNKELVLARDLLLPKLMNGEIAV